MDPMDDSPLAFDPDTIAPGGFPVRFGRYELNGVLGDGATARVFRAHLLGPANFRKPVALKVMRHDTRSTAARTSLLFDEARIGGRLVHPNLVETYDVGERGGRLYVAMQLVDGLTARQLFREVERLTPRAVLELVRQMADGLSHAHALQVDGRRTQLVHRDLKPANVLVGRDGIARIADFGIARAAGLTETALQGSIWGTLGYMAPEQAFGREATQASDVFALGLMMAEFATGRRFAPVKDLNAYVLALKELGASGPNIAQAVDAVVPGLGAIAARCVRLVPAERFPDGRALALAISEVNVPGGRGLATQIQQVLGEELPGQTTPGASQSAPPPSVSSEIFADAVLSPEHALDESIATIITAHGGEYRAAAEPAETARPGGTSGPAAGRVFIGREAVCRRLVLRLTESDRLVTLVGLGGAGKSRLAAEVARALGPTLAGGLLFCDLSGATGIDALLESLAASLGVAPPSAEPFDAAVERLGGELARRGPLVLTLDGFDQLTAWAAQTVGRWLALAPEVRFLVTSRAAVGLDAFEFVERVGPMSPIEGRALFLLRAAHALRDRPADPELFAEIDVLVAMLDGIPLAIELAASLIDAHVGEGAFAEALVARVDEAMATGDGAGLTAGLDLSWSLLAPWEQDALSQLTVFRGGFTLEAVQAVLDLSAYESAPFPLYVLEALVEASLVHVLPSVAGSPGPFAAWESGTATGMAEPVEVSESRFGMSRAVNHYAERRLDASPSAREAAERRHALWFARFGDPAWVRALDGRGGARRRWALAREHENLLAATRRSLAGLDAEIAAGAALALAEAAPLCGQHEAARELAQEILAMDAPVRTRAWLALRLASLWRDVAQADLALGIAQETLRMANSVGDEPLAVRALELIAACELEGATLLPEAALADCEAGLDRALAIPDRVAFGILLGRRGAIELDVGDAVRATELLRQALSVHRETGNRRGEISELCHLGRALLARGRLAEAARALKSGVVAAREIGDPQSEAHNLRTLAELSLSLHRLDDAQRLADRAFQLYGEAGNARLACATLGLQGEIHASRGDLATARSLLEQAISTCDELQHGAGMGALRAVLASVTAAEGDISTARYLLKAAETFLRDSGDRAALARMLIRRGHIEAASVNLVGAWTACSEATALATGLAAGPESPIGRALATLANELTEV